MKAYVLEGINDLRYEDVREPEPEDGWVLVKVGACGICSSDIPRIFTKGTYHFPTIPGHEFAGTVVKAHDAEGEKWVGKRVGVFPLIPCRKCPQCLEKKYEMCEHYDYTGSRRDGAFAEYVAVPAWNLIELPENVSLEEAAMLEPLSVAVHAVKRADIRDGMTVGVVGTGMIGISVGKWAQSFGAGKVVVLGRGEGKRDLVENAGLEYELLNTCEERFDRVIEAVGTPEAVEQAVLSAKAEGRIVFMGNPSGDITLKQDVYWSILRKQLTITGTWNSSYESCEKCDWTDAVSAISSGKINVRALISHSIDKEDLDKGLKIMRDHSEPYCRIISRW